MSVLIKGFEMPKDGCKDCVMVERGFVSDICPFLKREVNGNVERGGKPNGCPLIEVPDKNVGDTISRQDAIEVADAVWSVTGDKNVAKVWDQLRDLPPAQREQLTDKEQRIFLAAMEREEKVCELVDAEDRDCREPYEDSLVRTCREIIRKVKGVLWTTI